MKMTKEQRLLHAFPAGKIAYLTENKGKYRRALIENAPLPAPLYCETVKRPVDFGFTGEAVGVAMSNFENQFMRLWPASTRILPSALQCVTSNTISQEALSI